VKARLGLNISLQENKTDIFFFTEKDQYDLTPVKKENRSLDDLRNTWMANQNAQSTVFISAKTRDNIEELRQTLYREVKKIHVLRYPYNNLLYEFQ